MSEKKRAVQVKREKLAMAAQEAGLRDAALRFTDRERPFSEATKGRVTEVESETESDTGAMLIVALCVALLSIIRRMSSV